MDPRRPDKVQKYKVPAQNNNAAPGEDLTPDYMNILDPSRKRSFSKCSERFKVVKIESSEPFKRGRWKCMDFLDQSYDRMAHYNSVMYKSSDTNLNQSISSENWDNDNSSMLQIFQQQNIIMALDENKENISIKTENYECNDHGNYVLLPGMVSSSLIGIKYPFELNFLPISSSEHNLVGDSSESEIKSLHSQKSDYSFNQENNANDLNLSNNDNDQVTDQIKVICQNDEKKQNNLESKMSNGNIHYIPQNNEIQSGENQINNNQQINREVFNNCKNVNSVPPNLNVINPNMNQVGNNHGNIDPNIQHKEIIDNNFKQNIITQNSIQTPVNNAVFHQQHIFTNEVKNVNQTPNQEQFNINHNKENFTNINQQQEFKNVSSNQQETYKNVNNIPEVKICNVQNLNNQNYPNDQQKIQYASGNNVDVKPQLINKPLPNQTICQNNLSVRTHTYDVMPEMSNQNQTVYTNSHFNKSNHVPNHERNLHDDVNFNKQNYEIHLNSVCHNGNNVNNNNHGESQLQCINNYKGSSQNQNNRLLFVNEQMYQKNNSNNNNTDFTYQKDEKSCNNNNNGKEELYFSRPMSAKCIPDDQKSKFSNPTSQQFSFIPELNQEQSQTSLQNTNINSSSENGHVFLDQTQLYMPIYPIGPSPYMQNMYFPVYSNTVQIPLLNQNSNNENLNESALSRRPIAYQKIIIPQSINANIKKTNQFYYQQNNQTKSSEIFDCVSPPNNESSPRSEVANNSSLDVKIEALMDLVKKHVKFAIMEDIHSLKQKIILLKERVAQLEFENEMLKSNVEEFKKIKDKMG